jgi:hypothetical protein
MTGRLPRRGDCSKLGADAGLVAVAAVELAEQGPGQSVKPGQTLVIGFEDVVNMIFQPGPKVAEWSRASRERGHDVLKLAQARHNVLRVW